MKKWFNKDMCFNFLIAPILPLGCVLYYIYSNIVQISIVYNMVVIVGLIALYKAIVLIKRKSEFLFRLGLLSTEWFILDVINILSNNAYIDLKPSVLETSIKLGTSYMI